MGHLPADQLKQLEFQPETRVQASLTAAAEKRLLIWLAERTPPWVNSDHLTVLGVSGQLLAGVCYALARWNRWALLLATFFLAVNWLGDSLDGTLARVRGRQRPRYGFYVDHVTDTFGACFLMGGLAFSGYTHAGIAAGMLIAFLMLSIEVYLATHVLHSFQLSFWKLGPTELRIVLAIGNVTLLYHPVIRLLGHDLLLFDVGGVVAIAAMLGIMVHSAIRHTLQLYREERLP